MGDAPITINGITAVLGLIITCTTLFTFVATQWLRAKDKVKKDTEDKMTLSTKIDNLSNDISSLKSSISKTNEDIQSQLDEFRTSTDSKFDNFENIINDKLSDYEKSNDNRLGLIEKLLYTVVSAVLGDTQNMTCSNRSNLRRYNNLKSPMDNDESDRSDN